MSEANNFLNKLRMADSATKRRWLVGLSFAAALIVVFAWGQYFNSLVLPPSAVQGGVPDQGQTFTFGSVAALSQRTEADLEATIFRNVIGFGEAKGIDRAENADKILR